jgi:hypothetical protein
VLGWQPKYAQSSPSPVFESCTEKPSTTNWNSGAGCWIWPFSSDSGTLNSTTLPPFTSQWPALRKQWLASSNIQTVHPCGMSRPARGSFDGTRSSSSPQIEAMPPGTGGLAHAQVVTRRLGPAPGSATISTITDGPLK